MTAPTVAVIIIFKDEESFLAEAIESVIAQSFKDWKLYLVDDGSSDRSSQIAQGYSSEKIVYLDHPGHQNLGMSASRNAGIRASQAEFVAFLDADDIWYPTKLEEQILCLKNNPQAGLVYGAVQYWHSWHGTEQEDSFQHFFEDSLLDYGPGTLEYFLRFQNEVPCPSTFIARRELLEKIDGFESSFKGMFEDQAFLSKAAFAMPIYRSCKVWSRYRQHDNSCCSITRDTGKLAKARSYFRSWLLDFLRQQSLDCSAIIEQLADFEVWSSVEQDLYIKKRCQEITKLVDSNKVAIYGAGKHTQRLCRFFESLDLISFIVDDNPNVESLNQIPVIASKHADYSKVSWLILSSDVWEQQLAEKAKSFILEKQIIPLYGKALSMCPAFKANKNSMNLETNPIPKKGMINWGDLRRLVPMSRSFGLDRGQAIDRYYIESFLEECQLSIQGNVLEVRDDTYTRLYGTKLKTTDVIDLSPENPKANIIGDLALTGTLQDEFYDCIILTQTLQLIYKHEDVIQHCYKALKPGGILLLTVPGITQVPQSDMQETGDCWRYTTSSLKALTEEHFSADHSHYFSYGNVLSSIAFLAGTCSEELNKEELDTHDPQYQMLLAARCRKETKNSNKRLTSLSNLQANRSSAQEFCILNYHSVVPRIESHPLTQLQVTTAAFEEQIDYLSKNYKIISFDELYENWQTKSPSKAPFLLLTFDDGYFNNFSEAYEILKAYSVPATCFLTSSKIDSQDYFWWDLISKIVFSKDHQSVSLPESLGTIKLEDRPLAYRQLVKVIKQQSPEQISSIEKHLRKNYFNHPPNDDFRAMTWDNARSMRSNFSFAGHTQVHCSLSSKNLWQEEEISKSIERVIHELGSTAPVFAYPFGQTEDYCFTAMDILKDYGIPMACSTIEGPNNFQSNPWALKRFAARNWNAQELEQQMKAWMK